MSKEPSYLLSTLLDDASVLWFDHRRDEDFCRGLFAMVAATVLWPDEIDTDTKVWLAELIVKGHYADSERNNVLYSPAAG